VQARPIIPVVRIYITFSTFLTDHMLSHASTINDYGRLTPVAIKWGAGDL